MTSRVMPGIEDLTGREFNGIRVERLASRSPVRWHVRCTKCGSNWIEDHVRVRYIGCRNASCGRPASEPRRPLVQTGNAIPATRTRDSDSARQFHRGENTVPTVRWAQPDPETFRNADPDSLRGYLDQVRR